MILGDLFRVVDLKDVLSLQRLTQNGALLLEVGIVRGLTTD